MKQDDRSKLAVGTATNHARNGQLIGLDGILAQNTRALGTARRFAELASNTQANLILDSPNCDRYRLPTDHPFR